jgi:hypothetical protein
MRLVDDELIAGLFEPMLREDGVEILVQLARGIVRRVQQRNLPGGSARHRAKQRQQACRATPTVCFHRSYFLSGSGTAKVFEPMPSRFGFLSF